MPKTQKKQAKKSKRSNLLDEFEILNGIGPIGPIIEPDRRSNASMPALRRTAGNEMANEEVRAEAEHKEAESRKSGAVKDQNGPRPQNNEEEQEISLENISIEELERNIGLEDDNQISNEGNHVAQQVPVQQQVQAPVQQQVPAPQQAQVQQQIPVPQQAQVQQQQAPAQQQAQVPQQAPAQQRPQARQQAQAPLQNLALNKFQGQQTPRSEWSTTAQANNLLWRGVGKTIGKASVLPLTIVGNALLITPGIRLLARDAADMGQQRRDHKAVPGRPGEKFSSEGAVLADFRRVPTVWSYLTAGEATDNQGQALAPKVTVYIEQPKTGSSRSMHFGEMGHTMLGIEYTRYSKITGKPERYNIKYGFYPAGGMVSSSGTAMMLKGAVVPGQLIDDATHNYDISKSYESTPENIEKIAKASESYTEKGGYGYYTRNCTTFVRDMFKEGDIPTATVDQIFTEEKVRFNSEANAGLVFTEAWNGFWDTDVQRRMGNYTESNDRSYQGWGNKRVTKEDFDRYQATKNSAGFGVKSLAPASAGENIRRMKDPDGQLGSFRYIPDALKKDSKDEANAADVKNLSQLRALIRVEGHTLAAKIEGLLTKEERDAAAIADPYFMPWLGNLNQSAAILDELDYNFQAAVVQMKQEEREGLTIGNVLKPQEIKKARADIADDIALTSRIYQTILGSDSRLNKEVMNLLSLMQLALHVLDKEYRNMSKASDTGDLGTLREDMVTNLYTVRAGGREVEMTPTHYESYLQIYKTPTEAVRAYARYKELKTERDGHDSNLKTWKNPKKWSSRKLDEWNKLARNEELARQLDQSHREMLNKNSFSQSDINYAFRLRRMETAGTEDQKATGGMYENYSSASVTYMTLFFDKIFGGMQERARKPAGEGGGIPANQGLNAAVKWLDDYLTEKTRAKMGGMGMILRGIMSAYSDPTAAQIKFSLDHFLLNVYLRRIFRAGKHGAVNKVEEFGTYLDTVYDFIKEDPQKNFTKTINELIGILMKERQATKELAEGQKKTGQKKRR